MIIKVFLMGGVGNQLFQINRALSLHLSGHNVKIIHLGKYKKIINFIINHQNHQNWIHIENFCKKINLKVDAVKLYDLFNLSYLFILRKLNLYKYFDLPLTKQVNLKKKYDIGYFQNKNHFLKEATKLLVQSLIDYHELKSELNSKKKIGFHLRGGDFMENKNNTDYNKKPNFELIKFYIEKFDKENSEIFIVTNDKKLFSRFKNKSSVELYSSNELNDFKKLIQCNLMYVSQSTFSFWAYLVAQKINDCNILNKKDWYFKEII